MSLEGASPLHIQVKSRVQRRDRFPIWEATKHILDAWEKHLSRGKDDSILVVVLERGVKGEENLAGFGRPLADSLSSDSGLRAGLRRAAGARGINSDGMDRLLSCTVVVGVTWEEVTAGTVAELDCLVDLPPSGLGLVERHLRTMVADAADANATTDYEHRRRLSRTELVEEIETTAGLVDISSLEFAVREGICEPLDLTGSVPADDRFYEGTATQPHHVAAGLVVPQPTVMDKILFGLDERSAVVISGPSGVGKSAVLWTVPLALSGVLWYRVRRLADGDVPHLIRLARAYRATRETPVGFLVDAAGTDALGGWARLRAEAATVPGVLLVGTARSEDLITLGDLSDCVRIPIRLDETAAETIFRGLERRGATTVAHWAEAFANSDGLTLEFTHMLTRGRRLHDVISEQVRRRIADKRRHLELEVLSLVSVADRWTVSISTPDLAAACAVTDFELRKATSRLAHEHLVIERDGAMSGLHRLRSTAISDVIHDQPPPDLHSTVRRVLDLVPDSELCRFVANLLRDEPSAKETIINAASSDVPSPGRLVAYLHGLRLSDFHKVARVWKGIADDHRIPESSQALLFYYTAVGVPVPDLLPHEIRAAQEAMNTAPVPTSRDDLVAVVGEKTIAELLALINDVSEATAMFAVLETGTPNLVSAIRQTLNDDSPLVRALDTAPVDQLAELMATARSCDRTVAEHLVGLIGGRDTVLLRVRAHNPWITELEIRAGEDGPVAYGRFLHVSDIVQGNAQEEAVALGQVLLRCLPSIESVDIQALTPGGQEIRIGNRIFGVTHLQRQYDHSLSGIAWNQARIRGALTLVGEADTVRLAKARPLLDQAASLTYEAGTQLVTGTPHNLGPRQLTEQINELHELGQSLGPRRETAELDETLISQQASVLNTDHLSALIHALTGNVFRRLVMPDQYRRLAAYLTDTVIGYHLEGARSEPWTLLGMDGHPASLDRLSELLSDIHAVVSELATNDTNVANVFRSVRSGGKGQALHRAARTSRRQHRQRVSARCRALQKVCDATGLSTKVLHRQPEQTPLLEFAITVELGSLVEWEDAHSTLEAALGPNRPPAEIYLLVPLRGQRSVPSQAMQLIDSLLHSPDPGDWATTVSEPAPSELADTFSEAQEALQVLSGICHVPEDQQTHQTIQTAVEQATSRFRKAYERLLELPSDPLIDELVAVVKALAAQVQAELDGTHSGLSLAEKVALGVFQGDRTEEFDTILGARCLALEWEIDPKAALAMFADLSEAARKCGVGGLKSLEWG